MICDNFKTFPQDGELIGIDWGEKRIGIAVSDPERKFAFARPHAKDISEVAAIISDERPAGVILGLPLRTNGGESETTKRVRLFALKLADETDVPIMLLDESLTSFEAAERILGAGKDLDSESARILLENAIAVMNR